MFDVDQVAEELSKVGGVSKILLADNAAYKGFLPGKKLETNRNLQKCSLSEGVMLWFIYPE